MKSLENQIRRIKSMMLEQSDIVSNPYTLLIESKVKKIGVLVDKLGISPENAETFFNKCGNQSIFIAKKLKEYINSLPSATYEDDEKVLKVFNEIVSGKFPQINNSITSIMDYIIVGLNGNRAPIENLSFNEIEAKSKEWHDTLEVGGGDIDYQEENKIIADFRDKNGIGFYWVDFESNFCGEEKERMGHCANTDSSNTLYSLREVIKLGGNHTLNKSRLTAAVEPNGIIVQLKGEKNSKPSNKFHKYIIGLLNQKDDYDDYLINGFGSEYDSKNDFKISDLSDADFLALYEDRPELFTGYSAKKRLNALNLEDVKLMPMKFFLEFYPSVIHYYVDCDYRDTVYIRKTPDGGETKVKVSYLEKILTEPFSLFDYGNSYSLDSAIDYYIDNENRELIISLLEKNAEKNGMPFDDDLSLKEMIEMYDDDGDIENQIVWTISDVEESEYVDHLYDVLKKCLEEYGNVIEMNHEGVKMEVDLNRFINEIPENEFDVAVEDCKEEPECVFDFLLYEGHIEKPKFELNENWYPNIDKDIFNESLKERLNNR
jgi:hypothetical protein